MSGILLPFRGPALAAPHGIRYGQSMADAKQGMVPGFNHNVKHRGKVYHVQTEDSGLTNPQIVTHLFAGGNILASKKIFYGDIAEAENLVAIVRELMEEQHKDVLRGLVRGVYDDEAQSLAPEGKVYQPGELAPAPAQQPPAAPSSPPDPSPSPPAAAPISPPAAPSSPAAAVPVPPPLAQRPAQVPPPLPPRPRAAAQPPSSSLPPPVPLPAPPPVAPSPVAVAASPVAQRGEPSETISGEDLVSEKSLDEVILSYLAGHPNVKR
jgi:hypothetical protein